MIRQSDIDAVAKAINPHTWNDRGETDAQTWMPADIRNIREKRRKARSQARAAIAALQARGWHDGPKLKGDFR